MRTFFCWLTILGSAIADRARGELYDLKLEARVFNSIFTHPAVGDPLTVTFRVDSTDIEPIVGWGRYKATSATVSYPGGTYFPVEQNASILSVSLGGSIGDVVGYGARVQDPQSTFPGSAELVLTLAFPRGTIRDESLPLELPLSSANFTLMEVLPNPTLDLRYFSARVTSYSAQAVPEPGCCGLVVCFGLMARRRRRERNTSANVNA
jgi:hypothetical protein